jgi:hypothetical protein
VNESISTFSLGFVFCSSKDIEVASCNGDMAFLEVRVQQSVVEFILNHTEQIFNHAAAPIKPKGMHVTMFDRVQCVHLDIS